MIWYSNVYAVFHIRFRRWKSVCHATRQRQPLDNHGFCSVVSTGLPLEKALYVWSPDVQRGYCAANFKIGLTGWVAADVQLFCEIHAPFGRWHGIRVRSNSRWSAATVSITLPMNCCYHGTEIGRVGDLTRPLNQHKL